MDPRFLEIEEEFSNEGSNNQSDKTNLNNDAYSEIKISFDIKRLLPDDSESRDESEARDGSAVEDLDDEFILTIKFVYDDNDKHMKIINCTRVILDGWSRSKKFNLKTHYGMYNEEVKRDRLNEQHVLEISYNLPDRNSDNLLRILSIISDAIKINKVNTNFTLVDVIKKIDEEYKNNTLFDCECAKVISQLNTLLNTNSNITPDDAIFMLYCFNALKSFDCSKFLKPNNLRQLNDEILSTIDTLFLTQFNKPADNTSTEEEYQKERNKQQQNDINEFIQRINLWQRIKLYSPCLGKPADDGGVYHWKYTEWFFLREAKFLLNNTANVYFDLTQKKTSGSSYQEIYAKDADNHNIFGRELLALAPHINLSFPEKINWHEKITFEPKCSDYLFAMKLHFDLECVKTLLKARNNHRFFEQACKTGDLKTGLPKEIIKEIFMLALGPVVSLDEIDKPLPQSNALRF